MELVYSLYCLLNVDLTDRVQSRVYMTYTHIMLVNVCVFLHVCTTV